MQYGYVLSVRGPLADAANVTALARKGEALGFDYVSVTDHVVVPKRIASSYPYSETGAFKGGENGACLEMLAMLSFIAGATSTIRLVTSVMVLPHRPAVLTAKMLATIDVLSNGRLTLGCGVGWMREEFEALSAPPFDARGKVSDEFIEVFRELWTQDDPAYDGGHVQVRDLAFYPKPVQKPHPPIWIGGESDAAMRRTVRLADGWYPMGINPRRPLDTIERLKGGLDRLYRFAEAAGRDPSTIQLAYIAPWYSDRGATVVADGGRRLMTGTKEEIAGDIDALAKLGFRTLVLSFARSTYDRSVEGMERFVSEVKPLAHG